MAVEIRYDDPLSSDPCRNGYGSSFNYKKSFDDPRFFSDPDGLEDITLNGVPLSQAFEEED